MKRRDFIKYVTWSSVPLITGVHNKLVMARDVLEQDAWLTSTEAIKLITSNQLDLVAYTEFLLDRAERFSDYNIFITLDREGALKQAHAIHQHLQNGDEVSPLFGMPYVLKDNINTADLPTTGGTLALKNWTPPRDAELVTRIRNAHGNLFGKVNMHELAYGITSNNMAYGAVRNPYDRTKIPGGSSGGTAAAIAAGIVPFGMGSDTGGSCRIPAALCGCVGFRPSVDRYIRSGLIPISHTQDTPGPLGRTVDDVILLDRVCTADFDARQGTKLAGLRLGIPREAFYFNLDPALERVIDSALDKISNAGIELVEVSMGNVRELASAAALVPFESVRELAAYLWQYNSDISLADVVDQIADPRIKQRFTVQQEGNAMLPVDYRRNLTINRPRLQAAYQAYFKDNNLAGMLVPTTPLPARDIGDEDTVELNGKAVPTFPTFARNTGITSASGVPCISIPAGLAEAKLPVGIELVGPLNSDIQLLDIARQLETTLGRLPLPDIGTG
jgi:mandelamide amidase